MVTHPTGTYPLASRAAMARSTTMSSQAHSVYMALLEWGGHRH